MRLVRLVLWLMLVFATSARAADGPDGGEAARDAQERQAASYELFMQGRGMLRDGHHARAAQRLREALERWEHPAAHLFLGRALVELDQPVDALVHLWKSMRYFGSTDEDDHAASVESSSRHLLEHELARLVIESAVDERVRVAGVEVLGGRGRWEGAVRAGAITIVAGGEHAWARTFELAPGTSTHLLFSATGVAKSHERRIGPAEIESLQMALVGFDVVYPSRAELEPPEVVWTGPTEELPAEGAALCARAKHPQVVEVCRVWAAERRAYVEIMRRDNRERARAIHRLKGFLR